MLYSTKLHNKENEICELTLTKLKDKLNEFDNITIVSAYYSNETIEELFKLKSKKISLIFSAVSGSQEKYKDQVEDLKSNFESIKTKKNRKIRLCKKWPLLHSQIYFGINKRIDGAVCYVGSLNFSKNAFQNNEEILIQIDDIDTKRALRDYIELLNSDNYSDDIFKVKYKNAGRISKNLVEYISNGYLVYKPDSKIQLNFSNDELRKYAKELTKNTDFEIAEFESTLSIKIAELTGINEELDALAAQSKEDDDDECSSSIKANSVETCLGYWMPEPERILLRPVLERKKRLREKSLQAIVMKLDAIAKEGLEGKSIDAGLKRFIKSFVNRNPELKINENNFFSRLKKEVIKHINMKLNVLKRDEHRFIEGIYITPMPDFWDDAVTTKLFMNSFIDNVNFKNEYGRVKGAKLAQEIKKMFGKELIKTGA